MIGVHDTKQYLAIAAVNSYMLVYGIFNAWIDIEYERYFDELQYDDSFNLEEYEKNSILELFTFFIGPFVGSIFFGWIAMKFGRKIALLYMSIPMIMSCFLNAFVYNFFTFKVSIVLGGIFAGGIYIAGPLTLIEIVNNRYRGAILTSLVFSQMLGESVALGENLLWRNMITPWIRMPLTVAAAIVIYSIPDTPLSLVKRKKFEEAEKSIRFYKNIQTSDEYDMKRLKQELDTVKNVAAESDLEANQINRLQWADFKTKYARRALAIGIVLVLLNVCISNAKLTLHTALSISSARYLARILYNGGRWIVSIVALLGTCTAFQSVDVIGRKVLIAASAGATSLALFGNFLYLIIAPHASIQTWTDSILTITSLLAIFCGALGIRSLTFTVSTEIMPEKIRDVGVIFCGAFFWMFSYIFHAIFYFANDVTIVLIPAVLCLAGAVIIHFILPETKGKNHDEIMRSF